MVALRPPGLLNLWGITGVFIAVAWLYDAARARWPFHGCITQA